MPPLFLNTSQQPASHVPSRITLVPDPTSTQSSVIALIITGALVASVVSFIAYKQYRFRRKIHMLERMWQQPHRNRMK